MEPSLRPREWIEFPERMRPRLPIHVLSDFESHFGFFGAFLILLGGLVAQKYCEDIHETYIFKRKCLRYLGALGPVLEAALAQFVQFCCPKWKQTFIQNMFENKASFLLHSALWAVFVAIEEAILVFITDPRQGAKHVFIFGTTSLCI